MVEAYKIILHIHLYCLFFLFKLIKPFVMYIIINKTKQSKLYQTGNWPMNLLEQMVDKGDRVIVISLYSNTIKVPYNVDYNGVKEWEWVDFPLDENVLRQYKSL